MNSAQRLDELALAANENFQSGKLKAAASACKNILKLDKQHSSALEMLGVIKTQEGNHKGAIPYFKRAIEQNPVNARLYNKLASSYYAAGDCGQAKNYYAQALLITPEDPAILNNHAFVAYELGDYVAAGESSQKAVIRAPDNQQYRFGFARAAQDIRYHAFDPIAKEAFVICLKDPNIGHQEIMPAWVSLYWKDPQFSALHELAYQENMAQPLSDFAAILQDEFLLLALRRGLVGSVDFEAALVNIRRELLKTVETNDKIDDFLPFLQSLAAQCWQMEYLMKTDDEEEAILETLKKKLEKPNTLGSAENTAALLVYACYRPLHTLKNAKDIAAAITSDNNSAPYDVVHDVVQEQITDPHRELELRKTIESFGRIQNEISQKVRDQYEENPYPRWKISSMYNISEDFTGQNVLIAGCGTGKDIAIALRNYAGAQITAIDLSLSSLAYGQRRLEQMGLTENYKILHGDILELGQLDQKFDIIVSCGVLHHMDDPMAGWRVLRSLLKPKGKMKIALYSAAGRKAILETRDYIAQNSYKATPEGIKKLRKEIMQSPKDHPLRRCQRWRDFFNLSELRDMLFHVQEHNYNLPQLAQMLDELDLKFDGFTMNSNLRMLNYHKKFPKDSKGLNLDNWHQMELENPRLFPDMYQFYAIAK